MRPLLAAGNTIASCAYVHPRSASLLDGFGFAIPYLISTVEDRLPANMIEGWAKAALRLVELAGDVVLPVRLALVQRARLPSGCKTLLHLSPSVSPGPSPQASPSTIWAWLNKFVQPGM